MADRLGRSAGILTTAACLAILATACSTPASDFETTGTYQTLPGTETTTTTHPTTTTTQPTTTTTTPEITRPTISIPTTWDSIEDEIKGRYLLYAETVDIALGPPRLDPSIPGLETLAAQELADDVRNNLAGMDQTKYIVFPDTWRDQHHIRVKTPEASELVEGLEIELQDCELYDYEYVSIDGTHREHYTGATLWNVWMRYDGREWIVGAKLKADERSSGFDQCVKQG